MNLLVQTLVHNLFHPAGKPGNIVNYLSLDEIRPRFDLFGETIWAEVDGVSERNAQPPPAGPNCFEIPTSADTRQTSRERTCQRDT